MGPVLIEAVPAITLCSLAETLVKRLAVIVEHVVLARNVEDAAGFEALERFRQSVKLFPLGKLCEVAGVQNERGRRWQRVDLGNRLAQRCRHIRVGVLVESDVAIAYLHETQVAS